MIMITLMISSALIFILLKHPLTLGMMLLIETIMIALLTGQMKFNFWFSYIIFLIMIGGMLILFTYMTSVASNEKFKFSWKPMILVLITFFTLIYLNFDSILLNFNFFNNEMFNQNINFNFKLSLNKFINQPLNNIFFLMIIYLLITLIIVIKITNIKHGPVRQKF